MASAAAPNNAQTNQDVTARLTRVRERLRKAQSVDRRNDLEAQDDLLMVAGGNNQWPIEAVRERIRLGRPLYTGNRFPAMIEQVVGEVRANPPSIQCTPADSDATPAAAQVFEGLIRSIERLSQAQQAYAATVENAAQCGRGHLRIVPVHADDESFDVELRIRRIKNVRSVKWDPSAQEFDKSDANWCIVVSEVDRQGFEEAYPQVGPVGWANALAEQRKIEGWRGKDTVNVVEEWCVERIPYQRYRMAHTSQGAMPDGTPIAPSYDEKIIDGDPMDALPGLPAGAPCIDGQPYSDWLGMAQAHGWEIVQERTAFKKRVCMTLWGGDKQIAGPIEWKGSRIPIFTVPGRELEIDGETINYGLVRHARDAQRLHNYSRAADMELVSQAPKAPIIAADEQLDGHEDLWELATKQPVPFLRYNAIPGVAAPQERVGPSTNPGPQSLSQSALVDMEDTMGIHAASLGKKSNETSGVAINARDAQTDTGTFVFVFNLRLIVESIGRELVSAIPHYYSTRKQILILGKDDMPAIIELSQVRIDLGKYHIIAKTGPAYQTKREKTAELLMQMSKAAPEWAQPSIFMRVATLSDMDDADDFVAELRSIGQAMGALPPAQPQVAQPGQPMPGQPGAPPAGPGGPMPANVVPIRPPGPQQPMPPQSDPLAGVDLQFSTPGAPAARPHVGDRPRFAAPSGM